MLMPEKITRRAERIVRAALARSPAVVLTGPRQIGKTTLARAVARDFPGIFYDLEDRHDLARLHDPVAELRSHEGKLVVIDELQKKPDLFDSLRVVIDERRARGYRTGQFLLLGSASGHLMRQSGESLTGRIETVQLAGIDCLEVDPKDLPRLLERGGYPDSYTAPDATASQVWRRNYVDHQIVKELPAMGIDVAAEKFSQVWATLCQLHGNTVNVSGISRRLGISIATVSRHLRILEGLMLVRILPPWHGNIGKQIVKSPKCYVRDSGLLHAMRPGTDAGLAGAGWEGFVIENVMAALPALWRAFFYRNVRGSEIDLLLALPSGGFWAVEIKHNPDAHLASGTRSALAAIQPERAFVVHAGSRRFDRPDGSQAVPLSFLMNELLARNQAAGSWPPASQPVGSDAGHRLSAALYENAASLPLLRREFVREIGADMASHVAGGVAVGDARSDNRTGNALIAEAARWLEMEGTIHDPGLSDRRFLDQAHQLIEGIFLLKQQEGEAGQNAPGKVAPAAYNAFSMFIHALAALIEAGADAAVNFMLAEKYLVAGEHVSFRIFAIAQCDPQALAGNVLHEPCLPAERLLEAEALAVLYSILTENAGGILTPVLLLSGPGTPPPLDFFMRCATRRGMGRLQLCLGCTDAQISRLAEGIEASTSVGGGWCGEQAHAVRLALACAVSGWKKGLISPDDASPPEIPDDGGC